MRRLSLILIALCAGCGADVRHVPDRAMVKLELGDVDPARWVQAEKGWALPSGAEFTYPALIAQGPQDLKDPRPVVLSSAAQLIKGPDGGLRLVCGQPDDRAKRIEVELELRDGRVVLAFPADAPFVPWVRADGSVRLVARERVQYLPKVEDPATQPETKYLPLVEGLRRIEKDAWTLWE